MLFMGAFRNQPGNENSPAMLFNLDKHQLL